MNPLSFESVWDLKLDWFESPNYHRGGWSGVIKWQPVTNMPLFIKKQENYVKRTWRHPLKGVMTACYEHDNLKRLQALLIPVPQVLFFAQRCVRDKRQALLVTASLEGYVPLDTWLIQEKDCYLLEREKLMEALAEIISNLHHARLAHCALYPKHIFVKYIDGQFHLSLIDLEKLRFKPIRLLCALHDLNKLNRHLDAISYRDRLRFLKKYLTKMRWTSLSKYLKQYLYKKYLKP